MAKKETEVVSDKLTQGKTKTLDEIGTGEPVEVASELDMIQNAELTKFMNDILTIRVHPDDRPGSLPVICPSVNAVNQPIIRGREAKVKRKYVEALARCRTTTYVQREATPGRPENIQLDEITVITYPFAVLHDPHPKGAVWLEAIIAQP